MGSTQSIGFRIFAKDEASATFNKLSGTVGKLKGALAVGAGLGFFKSAVDAGSDMQETLNKTRVIFGQNSAAIEAWSETAAEKLGLSKRAALDSASGFGDMFTQLGIAGDEATRLSKTVVQMSADFGSFNNLPTAEVTDMISAAFRGEYDSLQRVIPNINAARVETEALALSQKKNAKELTAAEKALAVVNILQKDGASAAGDFARTSDGLANKQKILAAKFEDTKAELGQGLAPAMEGIVDLSSDMLDAVKQLEPGFRLLGESIKWAAEQIERVQDIGGGGFKKLNDMTKSADAFDKRLAAAGLTWEEYNAVLESAGGVHVTVAEAAKRLGRSTGDAAESQKRLGGQMQRTKSTAEKEKAAVDALKNSFDALTGKAISLSEAEIRFRDSIDDAAESLRENGTTLDINSEAGRRNRSAVIDAAKAAQDHAQAVFDQTGDLRAAEAALRADERAFRDQAVAAGLPIPVVDALIKKYFGIPKNVRSKVDADTTGADAKLMGLSGKLRTLKNGITIPVEFDIDLAQLRSQLGQLEAKGLLPVGMFASGTNFAPGGLAMVGEEGPELVNLPRGSKVYTAEQTRSMSGSMRPDAPLAGGDVIAELRALRSAVTSMRVQLDGYDVGRVIARQADEYGRA